MPEDHPQPKPDNAPQTSTDKPETSESDRHRLSRFSGIWKDHPELDEFVESVAAHRHAAGNES